MADPLKTELTALGSVDPAQVVQFSRDVAALIARPIAETRVAIGNQATLTRRFSFTVVDRKGDSKGGVWLGLLSVSDSLTTGPAGSQTLALSSGLLHNTLQANKLLLVSTDADGKIGVDVTLGGAGTRYVNFTPLGRLKYTGAVWV